MQANLRATSAQRTTANDQVTVAREQVTAAQQQVVVAQAVVKQRQADLDNAKLQLSYTTLVAPANGHREQEKRAARPGGGARPAADGPGERAAQPGLSPTSRKPSSKNMRVGQKAEAGSGRLPQRRLPGPHRVAVGRHRRPLRPAAPRQRQRQLRESNPARARQNRARQGRPRAPAARRHERERRW
ncbi:MAG: hypothetical protein WKG07_23620 [Hymenobacter sp.]